MVQPEDTIKVDLHELLININGEVYKNGNKDKSTMEERKKMSQQEYNDSLPDLTLGDGISNVLGNKSDCKDVEESAKFYRMHAKIHNKSLTGKGEWIAHIKELEELKECLLSIKPVQGSVLLSPILHGQIYMKIEDYIIKIKASAA